MSDSTDDLSVLDDRTAAHSLYDPTCFRYQSLIRDLQDNSPVDIIISEIDIRDLYFIVFNITTNRTA